MKYVNLNSYILRKKTAMLYLQVPLIGNIRNHPIFHSYHQSKSGILLDDLVVSHQNTKQKSRISSILIEMRHFFLVYWDMSNLLSFFQK